MYVCLCHGISDKTLKKLAYEQGVDDIREIRKLTPLGSQCGKCIRPAKEILQEAALNPLYKKVG
ncbi:bacterioferritin [Grimontia sp. AD028]|uniref:Bacterioferritin-associated ferredoxin n=3 Tax=Grimontia TaxID=246861 RepID=R1GNM0_9GAMM|nr:MULTISPECIES: bacterioferritin-associated ferredoxin [Grimontia]EOD77699.1 Bacterioferritin-associated ferredoxin [Grimontia indica]KKD59007.1 bacterioferritin [Grimontia sp. AD028]NGO00363.1 bacterioferritin-associated ferredoxin [Grimontia sedimenti]CZF85416.1 Bacterioferritin-associated ferredoxin [Grimontia celer]